MIIARGGIGINKWRILKTPDGRVVLLKYQPMSGPWYQYAEITDTENISTLVSWLRDNA